MNGQMTEHKGVFAQAVSSSVNGTIYHTLPVEITADGRLFIDSLEVMTLHACSIQLMHRVIKVTSQDREARWFQCDQQHQFMELLTVLASWRCLKPPGLMNKAITIPFIKPSAAKESLLVASCKCYTSLPSTEKVKGPIVSMFRGNWFSAMCVLDNYGQLQLMNERDGSILTSMDITKIMECEIRGLHHSLFNSGKYLFLGPIDQYRRQNNLPGNTTRPMILKFEYIADVEDWMVALKTFATKWRLGYDFSNTVRMSRLIHFDILEAMLNSGEQEMAVYCEVQVWGNAWFRTSLVNTTDGSPFFREEFVFDLMLSSTMVVVELKRALGKGYNPDDELLGSCVLEHEHMDNDGLQRLPLIGLGGEIGRLSITMKKNGHTILPPDNFSNFEQMVLSSEISPLLTFLHPKTSAVGLPTMAKLLIDMFQGLNKQDDFFKALMNQEISKIMEKHTTDSVYNTLFRGNSLLTKALELYNLRVGQEYLEQVIGGFISRLISKDETIEIDPVRLTEGADIDRNFTLLLGYMNHIWERIYSTSNDLPMSIKQQLSSLRKTIEMFTVDEDTMLNCITGFVFLRFFCPVILNPKLFYLSKDHQTGHVKRSLTLISKILLTFGNRSSFGAKEPYLTRFNDEFIDKHKSQLLDYLGRITLKKLDFSEKKLKLSTSLERMDIGFKDRELPLVPHLIDKYLSLDQLCDLFSNHEALGKDETADCDSKRLYKIGSLEFEKLVVDERVGVEFGSEQFIKTLLQTSESEQVFRYLNSETSLTDLILEATRLSTKKRRLVGMLSSGETVEDVSDWDGFTQRVLSTTVVDSQGHLMKVAPGSPHVKYLSDVSTLKTIFKSTDEALQALVKQRLPRQKQHQQQQASAYTSPTKKLTKMIRSASLNTVSFSSFDAQSDKRKSRMGKWFKKREE